jgi:hypothetical protein
MTKKGHRKDEAEEDSPGQHKGPESISKELGLNPESK